MNALVRALEKQKVWPLESPAKAGLVLLGGLSLGLLLLGTAPFTVALGGVLLLWICAVPAIVHLQNLDEAPVPILPFAGVFYAMFFALPIFAAPLAYQHDGRVVLYKRVVLDSLPMEVAILVAAGVAAMIAAYYLAKFTVLGHLPRLRVHRAELTPNVLQALYWALIVASLAYRYSAALQSLPSIGQFLAPVGYLGLGGLYLQWYGGNLPRWQWALMLLVVVPLEIYERVDSYALASLVFLPLFFTFILWRNRQFKMVAILAIVGAVLVASYSVTTVIRSPVTSVPGKLAAAGEYGARLFEKYERATSLLADGDGEVVHYPQISPLIHRIGLIWVFQHVYEQSPEQVPYWGGETYRPILTSFIPRIIYPDKPEERAGAAFGYRYGLTDREHGSTSFNIPWIVELLANFGPTGVLIGMAVFGLFMAFLDRIFNAPGMNEPEFLIGLTLLFQLGYQEANFSVMAGSLLPLFVSLYVYFRIVPVLLSRIWVGFR